MTIAMGDDTSKQPVVMATMPHFVLMTLFQQVFFILPQSMKVGETSVSYVEYFSHRLLLRVTCKFGVVNILRFNRTDRNRFEGFGTLLSVLTVFCNVTLINVIDYQGFHCNFWQSGPIKSGPK